MAETLETTDIETPDSKEEKFEGKLIFHTKRSIGDIVSTTVGKISRIIPAILIGDVKELFTPFTNKKKQKLQEDMTERYKNIHLKEDVHVGLGRAAYYESVKAGYEKKGEKLPLIGKIATKIIDFMLNIGNSNCHTYKSGEKSINLYGANPAIAYHEGGHAISSTAKEKQELVENSSRFINGKIKGNTPTLKEEGLASNLANRFMTAEEREKQSNLLEAAYGAYQGKTLGRAIAIPAAIATLLSGYGIAAALAVDLGIEYLGKTLGACWRRFSALFHKDKSKKNYLYDQEKDPNPYWNENSIAPVGQ